MYGRRVRGQIYDMRDWYATVWDSDLRRLQQRVVLPEPTMMMKSSVNNSVWSTIIRLHTGNWHYACVPDDWLRSIYRPTAYRCTFRFHHSGNIRMRGSGCTHNICTVYTKQKHWEISKVYDDVRENTEHLGNNKLVQPSRTHAHTHKTDELQTHIYQLEQVIKIDGHYKRQRAKRMYGAHSFRETQQHARPHDSIAS